MELMVQEFIKLAKHDGLEASTYYMDMVGDNQTLELAFSAELKKQLKRGNQKEFIYMVTFTIDKKKVEDLSESKIDEIEYYISSQKNRKALNLLKFSIVREQCKDGTPHWHALMISSKYLAKDRFNYYINKFGNIDISKNKSNCSQEIINYMSKSGTIKDLLG